MCGRLVAYQPLSMQLRLTEPNAQRLVNLVKIYKQISPDYDLSPTKQGNLLLAGRLGLAIDEAKKEAKKLKIKLKLAA